MQLHVGCTRAMFVRSTCMCGDNDGEIDSSTIKSASANEKGQGKMVSIEIDYKALRCINSKFVQMLWSGNVGALYFFLQKCQFLI